ncbi:MAG: glucokinase [Pseudomonadota bacterium]
MTNLIADIGATNARFALIDDGVPARGPEAIRVFSVQSYAGLEDAIDGYLTATGVSADALNQAAICIAGPVLGDQITMTNHPWAFSQRAVCERFGLGTLAVMNDFTAMALSLPRLKTSDRRQLGGDQATPHMPKAVLGPGTGLGVSGLIPVDHGAKGYRWQPLAGEGGHVTLAAMTDREAAILQTQQRLTGHVCAEDFLCGRGLVSLYHAICATDDKPKPVDLIPADVTNRALDDSDPMAVECVHLFCGWLGSVAGNLALTLGSTGGVYIAGGIVPRLGRFFDTSPFRDRFQNKGRFDAYLGPIPTYVVTHEFPAFLGLIAALQRD